MKARLLSSLLAAGLAAAVGVAAAPGGSHFTSGVVQDVDRAARVATIAHEPVPSLKWPAMTMQFSVGDAALFDRLPRGGRIALEFVAEGGGHRIVNAIPLAQAASTAPAERGHRGMGMMHGGMGGDMGQMMKMCEDMMGGSRRH
jgi:Cu/Ag efflux protein CusF